MQAIQGTKICQRCKQEKPLDDFRKVKKHGKIVPYCYCNPCGVEHVKEWRKNNPERAKENKKRSDLTFRSKDRQKFRDIEKERRRRYRLEAFDAYGGAKCACCGDTHVEFLAIDHINGGGEEHRKTVRNICSWLRSRGWPPGYRILCHNCNQSIGYYGYCPHQAEKANQKNESKQ